MIALPTTDTNAAPLRVMALHALLYCERLFYLEEVEEIRVADHAVYAGRRLHEVVVPLDDESPERRSVEVASETWGLVGKVDALRRRDGQWVAYEHKRGRCHRGQAKEVLPWPSDRIQAIAYAVLLEEALGEPVPQARIRYHADNLTAIVEIDEAARDDLRRADRSGQRAAANGRPAPGRGEREPLPPLLARPGLPAGGGAAGHCGTQPGRRRGAACHRGTTGHSAARTDPLSQQPRAANDAVPISQSPYWPQRGNSGRDRCLSTRRATNPVGASRCPASGLSLEAFQ
jgi:CRISPR-associated protein Cas4